MAPTCTPYGPFGNRQRKVNYEGWLRSYSAATPHGRFCGKVARAQIRAGRFFHFEQPYPSKLYDEPPWPEVGQQGTTFSAVSDQRMVG